MHVRVLLDGGAVGQRLVRGQLLARRQQRRLRRSDAAARPPRVARRTWSNSSRADGAAGHQRRAAVDVVLRAATSPCTRARSASRNAICAFSVPLLAYSVRTSRTVCASCGLGLVERDLGVGRVEPDQQLAGLDVVGVVGLDRHHRAADLRRDLHHRALHVGVVGGLEVVEHQRPVDAIADGGQRDDGRHGAQCVFAPAVGRGGRRQCRVRSSGAPRFDAFAVGLAWTCAASTASRVGRVGRSRAAIATAQRPRQRDLAVEFARGQVGRQAALVQQRRLRRSAP